MHPGQPGKTGTRTQGKNTRGTCPVSNPPVPENRLKRPEWFTIQKTGKYPMVWQEPNGNNAF